MAPVAQEQRPAAERRHVPERQETDPRARHPTPSWSRATSPTGTSRSLSPLPMTRTNPPSIERSSRSRRSASLTRRPAAYSSSRSATGRGDRVGFVRVHAAGRLEETLGLVGGEGLGQQALGLRQLDVRGDVALDQALAVREPVEALERGRTATEARWGEPWVPGRPRRVRAAR